MSQRPSRSDNNIALLSRYGATGVLNTTIDFAVLNLLVWLFSTPTGVGLLLSNGCAFACANLNSYFWNKYWTFRDGGRPSVGQYSVFLLASLGGLLINSAILYLIVEFFSPGAWQGSMLWVNVAKLLATFGNLAWNFCFYRWVVFRLQPEAVA